MNPVITTQQQQHHNNNNTMYNWYYVRRDESKSESESSTGRGYGDNVVNVFLRPSERVSLHESESSNEESIK